MDRDKGNEKGFETGTDESFKSLSQDQAHDWHANRKGQFDVWLANMKRTYDEYQQESLESIKRNRSYVDKVLSDAQQHDNVRQTIANQALQNAVETANMVGKQSLSYRDALDKQHTAHRDVAADNLWNPVQQGAGDTLTARAVSIDDASLKAIGAMVAAAVAQAIAGSGTKG